MDGLVPAALVDDLIRPYSVGQVLVAALVVSTLAALPLRSRKVLSLNLVVFGLLLVVTPVSLAPIEFKFLGIALLVASPVVYMTARR